MPLRDNERLLVGANADAVAQLAAHHCAESLSKTTGACVALAGGSTPAILYRVLSHEPYSSRVKWHQVGWFWADERAVPLDDADSNFRMARETLLRPAGLADDAANVFPMPADVEDLDAGARSHEQVIRTVVPAGSGGVPRFDLILLGVGADGHTASLFPGTAAVDEVQRLVVPNFAPSQNAWRMTMTLPLLAAAGEILFFVTGSAKAEIMCRLLSEAGADLPAAMLARLATRVTWVLDADAARLVGAGGEA